MVCVFPGCADVLASDLRFNSALIMDDFPTFDFPANATSLNGLSGILLVIPQTVSKFTLLITIIFSSTYCSVQTAHHILPIFNLFLFLYKRHIQHVFHLLHEHDFQTFFDLR